MKTIAAALLSLSVTSAPGYAQVLKAVEAESCAITCASSDKEPPTNDFASGFHMAHAGWGATAGDSISWREAFRSNARALKLGVRYAYDERDLRVRFGEVGEKFVLAVDDARIELKLPTTNDWLSFETLLVPLPDLAPGTHTFRLHALEDHSDRNVDCFFFTYGELEDIPIGVRQTIVAKSEDGFFELWTAPETLLPIPGDQVITLCRRTYDFILEQTASEPIQGKIAIHVRPFKYVGGYQFQNARGVWFADTPESLEIEGVAHELNHFHQPYVVPFMYHPLVRVNDMFVIPPALYPEHFRTRTEKRGDYQERVSRGHAFLNGNPWFVDDPHDVAFALHVKYGPELQKRFYHLAAKAAEEGRIEKNKPLSPEKFVEFMSLAAGEDVLPMFERLRGFPDAVVIH